MVIWNWRFGVGDLEEVFDQAGGCAGPFEHLPDAAFGLDGLDFPAVGQVQVGYCCWVMGIGSGVSADWRRRAVRAFRGDDDAEGVWKALSR